MAAVPFANPTIPNLGDYTLFVQNEVGIGPAYLPTDSFWYTTTFNIAMEIVNNQMALVSPTIYTLMVYNLGADRIVNFATDQPGQTFFKKLKQQLRLSSYYGGVVQSSSDGGTSANAIPPDSVKLFTLQDLQTLKTPWGRQYMAFAQMYGRNIVGLS